ncbi:uncharacterized protein CTRU02_201296 [Colletotrichum truncatum]|uniref:Uncharacterized protein n=1 Tax=Colletotrichum truncatum TaxID=5467 RepID=A0ACC3ZH89_COLTU|nr:uncharacterized protein CTRU02_08085 [Colletotrichum truncatum]KAF6790565.1 hypothetical protein CTRU02_08085 [Colletotrichum truncatum]
MPGSNHIKPFALQGRTYVQGKASGRLLSSNLELSFWGGVNAETGEVIDRHHALSGEYLQDKILAIPGGRGSCSGSGVILELLLNNKGPRGMVFRRREDILTLGVMVAEEMFAKAIPVVTLSEADFDHLLDYNGHQIYMDGSTVSLFESSGCCESFSIFQDININTTPVDNIKLSDLDRDFIEGVYGDAARVSIRIILRMADLLGATELMDISQVHIDGCIYTGPGSLAFAEKLRDLGGRVRVFTSLNSISVDQKRWRSQGVDATLGAAATRLADAYTDMGAKPTLTCAPYQLESAPALGDQVAWAESNAVVYANSVLGARTMKYPDFLDIAIALTGRAPKGGPHVETNRLASLVIRLSDLNSQAAEVIDDSFYPLMGYHVGSLALNEIPVVVGMEPLAPSKDDLKAFGAAFATVSSAPMFHIVGVTPEAASLEAAIQEHHQTRSIDVKLADLYMCWEKLNSAKKGQRVDLVSLGNPHFSISEIRKLAGLCQDRTKHPKTAIIVACGRSTFGLASQAGLIMDLEEFGVQFTTDTCWCMITEPLVPPSSKLIMTNSGKYAHYGPGLTGRGFYFGSLEDCVNAACDGNASRCAPRWLPGCVEKVSID